MNNKDSLVGKSTSRPSFPENNFANFSQTILQLIFFWITNKEIICSQSGTGPSISNVALFVLFHPLSEVGCQTYKIFIQGTQGMVQWTPVKHGNKENLEKQGS